MAAGANLQLAREACLQAAEALSDQDIVGILGFDVRAQWVADFTSADRLDTLRGSVQRLFAGGGTNVHAALVEARRAMHLPRAQDCSIRHVVLLSDGETPPEDFESVIHGIRQDGTTISTICIGSGNFNAFLMRRIASAGGGRFLFTNSFRRLPQLFIEEAERVIGEARASRGAPPIRDPDDRRRTTERGTPPPSAKKILPRILDEHEVLRGIDRDGFPPLNGALGGSARETAFVPVGDADDRPLLAIWRFGLGKAAVWMSDLGGPRSRDWINWRDAPKLFSQLVRHLSGPAEVQAVASRLHITRRGHEVSVFLAGAREDETFSGLALERRVDGWAGRLTLERASEVVPLRLVWSRGDRVQRLTTEVMMEYVPEFDPRFPDTVRPGLPESRILPLGQLAEFSPPAKIEPERRDIAGWFFLFALLLLPIDVALRRVR